MNLYANEGDEAPAPASKVMADRIELLYHHTRAGLIATIGSAVTMVLALTGPRQPEMLWLAAMFGVVVLRGIDLLAHRRTIAGRSRHPRHGLLRYAVGTAATALAWSVFSLTHIAELDLLKRSMLEIVFGALACGSVHFFAPFRIVGSLFSTLLLLPTSLLLLGLGGIDNAVVGCLGIALTGVLFLVQGASERNTIETLSSARHSEELLTETQQRRVESEHLNNELLQVRRQLLDANQNLEHKVRERTEQLEHEIGERLAYQRKLELLANTDPLTQIGNRMSFTHQIAEAMDRASQARHSLAIYFIDLDRFKQINDGLGYSVGDRVLQATAMRLKTLASETTIVARWGGDEFVVLLPQLRERALATGLGESIVAALSEPIELPQGLVRVGASVGISIFPDDGATPAKLIESADLAMYKAKRDGGGLTHLYRQEWGNQARERLRLAQALRDAVGLDQLRVHFQPVVNLAERRTVCMEALCRWTHPDYGAVPPDVFIPLAEESGLIVPIGNWVLREACRTMQGLSPGPDVSLAVNTSVLQLMDRNFIPTLDEVLADTGLPAARLKLEITESLFAENADQVLAVLQALRNRGICISLDDFGTGYSSLSYLHKFPIDVLKVDASFVRGIDGGGESIIKAVLLMSESLGMDVIIEGVETGYQYRRVQALGANMLQGFFFSPGVTPEIALRDYGGNWPPSPEDPESLEIAMHSAHPIATAEGFTSPP